MSINKIILMGNLIRDPESRFLPGGQAVANFTIAVNKFWTDKSGEKKEEVSFIDCTAFGKTAENITKFFSKGKKILVEGCLRTETWKDKTDGSNRSKLKVIADTFHFVGDRQESGPQKQDSRPAQPQRHTTDFMDEMSASNDEDHPF